MTYKNYKAKIIYLEKENIFHGEVINIKDVITFQGTTVNELKQEFIVSIEDYFEFCKSRNEKPELPFNGFIYLQIPIESQQKLFNAARNSGMEFEDWIMDILNKQAVIA
jgi:predicted HicB family RNase H-like nuclease